MVAVSVGGILRLLQDLEPGVGVMSGPDRLWPFLLGGLGGGGGGGGRGGGGGGIAYVQVVFGHSVRASRLQAGLCGANVAPVLG